MPDTTIAAATWDDPASPTVEVIRAAPLSVQVCANSGDEQAVLDVVNRIHPCGTTAGWHPATDPVERPQFCLALPDRIHFMFHA